MSLPTDYDERKALPLWTFLMEYFPLTFLELVRISVAGDKQHLNNSEPGKIRWAREKSTDQLNTALRHQFDYGRGVKRDTDGRSHLGKAIWRLCAQSELDLEAEAAATPIMAEHPWKTVVSTPDPQPDVCVLCPHLYVLHVKFPTGPRDRLMCATCDETLDPGNVKIKPATWRPTAICHDCGVDLEEGTHAATCLRLDRQHY